MTNRPSEIFYRLAVLERSSNDENRIANVSFSSETPYERYFGIEILDHSPGAMDLEFLNSGRAPLLVDHNPSDPVGVVEGAAVGNDRIGRAQLRFGNSGRATEIWQDVQDGIRQNISVGYRVNSMEPDGSPEIFRVTSWTPLEISIVSIPADTSVGIGRSHGAKHMELTKEHRQDLARNSAERPEDERAPEDPIKYEQWRASSILSDAEVLADKSPTGDRIMDIARRAIAQGWPYHKAISTIREVAMDGIAAQTPIVLNANDEFSHAVRENYSLLRAINAELDKDWSKAGFEREMSQELERRSDKKAEGLLIPTGALATRTTMVVGTDNIGGYAVGTDHRSDLFIDSLKNQAKVLELGATVLPDLVGDVTIPKQSGDLTAAWVAESGDPGESNLTLGQVTLSPKTVGARASYSRRLLKQSTPQIEDLLRKDLQSQLALAVDLAAINGSGASNQPTGILQTAGIGSVAIGTNGGAITYDHIAQLIKEVAIDNALDGRPAFLSNSKVTYKLGTTPKQSSGVEGNFIQNEPGKLIGYQYADSNQVPSNLTKGSGTDLSAVIFGNFADLMIGMWGVVDLLVDPYTNAHTEVVPENRTGV